MFTIDVKGDVVDNDTATFYQYFGLQHAAPAALQSQLSDANGDDLTVNIASNGGDVFAASEMYTMLKSYSGQVNVVVQGLAASAASVIAMAGDKVSIAPTAQIMIHKAWTGATGNADDLAHQSEVMANIDQSIAAAYEAKTGMNQGDVLNLMAKETWLTATQAVDQHFADEIMFVDETQVAVTNSVADIPTKTAVNKLLNLINKDQPIPAPKQSNNENKPTLRDRKLAILLHKN